MKSTLTIVALAFALAACGAETEEPRSAAPSEAPAETPEPEEIAAPSPEEFPLPEDYADEAAEQITADNLEDQLASLEAELDEP